MSGEENGRISYLGENDSIGMVIAPNGLPYDRWFTTGTHLQLRLAGDASRFTFLPERARLIWTGSLGHDIYTPRNAEIETIAELEGDRPYSGHLSASAGFELVVDGAPLALVRKGRTWTHFTLDVSVGTIGPWSFAGPVQHTAHWSYLRLEGKPLPPVKGWGVAETAPGFVADLSLFADTTLVAIDTDAPRFLAWSGGRPQLSVRGGARADVGLYQVGGGPNLTILGGWMGDAVAPGDATFPVALYVYLRADGRAVAWNSSIDRRLLDGTIAARSQRIVGEFAAGAVLRIWRLEISWCHAFRTNETATLPSNRKTGQLLWHWSASYIW